ncbi:TM2 domain-containing protein [Maricaulaceae bacterium MS644]
MSLDTAERMLIEQRVTNDAKNIVVAYLLLIFLGLFGAHRFYLGRIGTAIVQLILTITFFGIIISGIWVFVDLFLVPGMVNQDKEKLRQRLTMEALSMGAGRSTERSERQERPADAGQATNGGDAAARQGD